MPDVLPPPVPRVVLDTNVLYAGLYSATGRSYQVLRALQSGRLRLVLSTPLLFEYEDVLGQGRVHQGRTRRANGVTATPLAPLFTPCA